MILRPESADVLFLRPHRKFDDCRGRVIMFSCGHTDDVYITGNPIEKIAEDLQQSYCFWCTWGVLRFEIKEVRDVPVERDTGLRRL